MENSFLSKFQPYEYPNFGYVRLPEIKITDEEREAVGAKVGCNNIEFLKCLARKGFLKKEGAFQERRKEYLDRAKQELDLFEKLGFVDYILLVWRVVSFCHKKEIAVDYGRGSAASSLIFYLLELTGVDPVKYGLFFERFVSETRAKKKEIDGVIYIDGSLAPDVDQDIERERRGEVIEYVRSLYPHRVCKITSLMTLSGKILIKECGKIVAELSEEEMKDVSDLIPKKFGIVMDLKDAYYGIPDVKEGEWKSKPVEKFKNWCDKHPQVFKTALMLRDLIKNKGTHASGYIISYDPLDKFMPLELSSSVDPESEDYKEEEIASAFPMEDVAKMTIKLDLLGARCCSVVADVIRETGTKISDINIDNDPIIYDNLQNLETPRGVFQIEAATNLQVCRKIKPKNLSELSDVVALARPGALSFLKTYVDNECKPVHPLFDGILAKTRGVCLYQESMMQLSHAIGFSLDEAETLRRIVGKKKVEQVAEWQKKIRDKVAEKDLPEELADLLWKILDDSSKYSFNASHSLSFAALAALTTYLKFTYKLPFYKALLKFPKKPSERHEEIEGVVRELRFFGIELLPPHLTKSKLDFSIEGANLRYGLGAIKGISTESAENLAKFQNQYSNKFEVFDSAKNSGLTIAQLCALIQVGCMDGLSKNPSRPRLTLEAKLWNLLTAKEHLLCYNFGEKFNWDLMDIYKHLRDNTDSMGKPYLVKSRPATIAKNIESHKAIYMMNKELPTLANYFYERMLLGYNYSLKLIDALLPYEPKLITIQEAMSRQDKDMVYFAGNVVGKSYEGVSNEKKTKYAKITVSDETGEVNCMVFNNEKNDNISKIKSANKGKLPVKNNIVTVRGRKMGDAVFAESIIEQSIRIYTKWTEKDKAEAGLTEDIN